MGKRRDKVQMSEAELWDFIEQQKSLQVATLNKDGSAHLSTLWFAIDSSTENKTLVFETYTKSQKIVNLQRDPRISVLLEDGVTYETLRGVTINAMAELYAKPEDVEPLAAKVLIRNHADFTEETAADAAKMLASKRTAVVIKLEKVISWDHTKLGGTY